MSPSPYLQVAMATGIVPQPIVRRADMDGHVARAVARTAK